MSIRIAGPFIDKISLSVPFDSDYVEYLVSTFRDCSDDVQGEAYRIDRIRHSRNSLYRWAFCVSIIGETEQRIYVHLEHHDAGKRQFRLEFNPAKMGDSHVGGLHSFFALVFNDVEPNFMRAECVVTRVDIALDLVGISMDEILICSTNKQVGGLWSDGKRGLKTAYCGSRNSREQVRAYDKPFPIQSRSGLGRRVRKRPRIRCEVTAKPHITIGELDNMQSVFRHLEISYLAGVKRNRVLANHETQYFIDSCFRRGTQAALALVENKREKRKYRDLLGQSRLEEIHHPRLWEGWHLELDRLQFLMGVDHSILPPLRLARRRGARKVA